MFKDNAVLGKLRFIGYIGVFALCGALYFALVFNDWCNMFYFGSLFSLSDELIPESSGDDAAEEAVEGAEAE